MGGRGIVVLFATLLLFSVLPIGTAAACEVACVTDERAADHSSSCEPTNAPREARFRYLYASAEVDDIELVATFTFACGSSSGPSENFWANATSQNGVRTDSAEATYYYGSNVVYTCNVRARAHPAEIIFITLHPSAGHQTRMCDPYAMPSASSLLP